MNGPTTIHLESLEQLQRHEALWDDLWHRSEVANPAARAATLAGWVRRFSPRRQFHAVVVKHDGTWLAAMPLVPRPLLPGLVAAGLPSNEWFSCGDLLLDCEQQHDPAGTMVVDRLVAGLGRAPWSLGCFDAVPLDAPRWKSLQAGLRRAGIGFAARPVASVPVLDPGDDWQLYLRGLSRSHRQKMTKAARRLAESAEVQVRELTDLGADEVERWLRRGFEVEDQSWKGEAGTSVLRTSGMFDFFLDQAQQLAQWGQLELVSLEVDGAMIAFLYGLRAKGVLYALKIGYDPAYGDHSPGQLLFYHLLSRLVDDPQTHVIDCMGPQSQTTARWRPSTYRAGRLAFAMRGGWTRGLVWGYRRVWPHVSRLTGRRRYEPEPSTTDPVARERAPVACGVD